MKHIIFTQAECEKIFHTRNSKIQVSTDLGLTTTAAEIKNKTVFINGEQAPLKEFEKTKENVCYTIIDGHLKQIAFFSSDTNFYYKLIPTSDWPTVTLSSTPMHRHTKISPKEDTVLKIKEISPVRGNMLDTCCGLGYTAISAAEDAENVFTFEKDPNVIRVAQFNPYSQELFENKKIKIIEEDVFSGIKKFKNNFFDRIIHDPPTYKYSPMLFSREFYFEMFRVLKKNGIIYHYAPSPKKTHDNVFYYKIIRKLKEAGFKKVEYREEASGVVGYKP